MIWPAQAHDPAAPALSARAGSTEEFAASKHAWDALLAASGADPLFMSWDWQWRWWLHHRRALGATLRLVAVYSGGTLVGLAPFYSRQVLVRGLLRLCRMELIGTAWRDPHAAYSDYLDIVAARDFSAAVRQSISEWLKSQRFWDELALCCIKRDGVAYGLVEHHLRRFTYVREVDPMQAWCAPLPPKFDQFVERLRSDVRRKLFNQRRKLLPIELQYAREADVAEFLRELWRYSAERWGAASSASRHRDPGPANFHVDFASCMARAGQLRLSRMRTAGGMVSVMYNVWVRGTVYYLQSGFDAAASRGASPGYLHFGYAIEAACQEKAGRFDFLAGPGRHREYKGDLLTEPVPVVTCHAVRGGLARTLYGIYGALIKCRDSLRRRYR
jgi:CelD/BcsL family acetyltransferase involved in cellulose biosynthesis